MRSTRSEVAALALGAVLLVVRPALADDPPQSDSAVSEKPVDPEAKQLFTEGLRHFNAGDYAAAIERFRAAYQRAPAAGLLYNLAQAHRLSGDCAQALILYRRYLASGPSGKNLQRTEARISEMEACARSAGPAPETTPGQADQGADAPSPLKVSPTALGGPQPALVVLPARAAPAPERSARRRWPYVIALGGAAATLGATSGYFGWLATRAGRDTSVEKRGVWSSDAAQKEAAGIRDERVALATGVTALVAAGVAGWLLLRD